MAFSSFKFPSKTKEEMEIGKQGLKKRILQQGDSWQTPFPGDHVQVHYSGRVDGGEALDSSRDGGIPFTFKLGSGEVIKGWDDGIATMRKGERAIFTIPPNLAYGEVGAPPLIPPNSMLVFDVELLSWNTVRDLSGDGGILKKIIKEGEGWATPKEADEVLVKYEARLDDGTIVSKSDKGVEFHIRDGLLCPAISHGVKTMRKGEKAELSVKFSYVVKNGNKTIRSGLQVPPNSNLTVDIELLSWKSVIDVAGDEKVVKKIIREGEGYDRPGEGSKVKVKYTGKLEDATVFERKGTDEEPLEFMCFEEQVFEGLDRAIMTMRKGEIALVRISSDYGFGNVECHRDLAMVPPNATLLYEVELLSFAKDKEFWKMDTVEKIEACQRKKDDGNKFFKAGKFWRASKKYEKAAKYVEYDHSFTDEEKIQATGLKISCNLNNAACKLKLGEYSEASRLCTKVLDLDPYNVKALYRRSQSYMEMSDLEKAEVDIKKILSIDPYNRDAKLEYKKLRDKQKEYDKNQSKLFGAMISRMSQLEI
ncbi:70 kDa peptidyl-prolyl isomerase-like [Magnolia sinica]|uniref:70 kDa peptidyl-prolyl isomerase-like n=1 Tax=Magnolia sinica TaxID=86752 RepID=UPI002658C2B1|nr:70 kDa peptidyl-prolyl isomerase-like [Magnolia sinica]